MNIAVLGAGSLGMLFAAKLRSVCSHVELIARSEAQTDRLNQSGIQVTGETILQQDRLFASSFLNRLSNRTAWQPDAWLLMVKQASIDETLLDYLEQRVGPHTLVVGFQNGMGHLEKLATRIPREQLIVAVTTEGARKTSPNTLEHTGRGITYIGPAYPEGLSKSLQLQLESLCKLMEKAGFPNSLSKNNILSHVWGKLLMNAVINPLTTVLQIRNGELLASVQLREVMRALFEEGIAVARAMQIELPRDLWSRLLEVCEQTASNHSSMLQDRMQGRRTEIDWINGSLLRLGAEQGIDLPVNQTLYGLVKALDEKRVSLDENSR